MPDFDPMAALAEIQNTLSADQGYRQAWIQANPDKARELGAVEYESGFKSPLTPEEHATLGAAPAGEIPQTLDAIAGTVNADAQYRQQYLTDNWRKMTDRQSAAKMSQAWNDVDPETLPKIKYPTGYEEPVTREELAWVASQRNALVSGLIRENPAQALTGLVAEPQDPHAPLTRDAFGNINREAVVQKLTRLRLTPAERLMAAQEYRRQQSANPNSSMQLGTPGGDPLYWVNRLSFAGPGMEAALALKAKDAITKIADDDKNGTNKATDDDYLMWSAYQERARVEQERSGKWPTWWVDNVSKLPGYVGEFVATSGTVNPVSRSVGVAAARRLGTGMLARTAGRATGVMVGEGLVRTALRPTSVAAEAAKSQVPDAQISYGAGGSPGISVTPGMGAGEATLRAVGKVGAENVSESLISDALTSLIPKGAPPILKSIFGKEKKGIVEQMRATSKFENFPVQMAEEYLNDVLEYPLNTPDENKQSVITAIATGDYKTVADDFLRKAAVLGPMAGTSAAAERLAQGEPQSPVEAPPRQTAPSAKTRGWIGTPNWPPEGINLQTVTDPELRQHLVVNDLSRRMHTQIDQGGRTTQNFERYGREFTAADPVAASAIINSGRSSLAKIREHFPGFPDVSGVEGDHAVRASFVAGIKKAFNDYEHSVYWPRAERNLPFVKVPWNPETGREEGVKGNVPAEPASATPLTPQSDSTAAEQPSPTAEVTEPAPPPAPADAPSPPTDADGLDRIEQKLAERRRKRLLKPVQPESPSAEPGQPKQPQAEPDSSHPEPWQMSYQELRNALNPSTRDELEKARPLLAKMYKPDDARVTANEADDPWGIHRAIHKGDQIPRVPMHDLSLRHKEAIREALKEGKQVPQRVLDEYEEFSKKPESPPAPAATQPESLAPTEPATPAATQPESPPPQPATPPPTPQTAPRKWPKQTPGPGEPPIPEGFVRMYHGGARIDQSEIDRGLGRWTSPDRAYAQGYANKSPGSLVHYTDVPEDDPALEKSYDDSGTSQVAPPVAVELPLRKYKFHEINDTVDKGDSPYSVPDGTSEPPPPVVPEYTFPEDIQPQENVATPAGESTTPQDAGAPDLIEQKLAERQRNKLMRQPTPEPAAPTPPAAPAAPQPDVAAEPPAPAATPSTPASGVARGSATSIQVYGSKSHPAEYRVVPLESLVSSHTFADGNVTSNIKREIYPPELQENDYSIGTPHYFKVENNAKAKVANYWVSDNPDAINGPPIIGRNNLVINGNGRTMTLQLAAHNNDYQWYRDALDQKASQFGIDPAAYADMKHPVLVRAVDMDERTAEAFTFAKEANRPATMQNSLRDQAASYVDLLPSEAFSTIEADDIGTMRAFIKDSPTGRRFVEKLFERFPEQSRKMYFNHSPDGLSLTGAGEELVTNILAVAAVPKDIRSLLQRNAPGLDNNLTANSSAILALKVKDKPTYDDFLKAVEYVGENPSLKTMRDLNDDLRTGRMFREPLTEKQKSLARFVFKNYNSPSKLRDGLRAMVRDVAFTKPGNSLFGTPEPATQSDIDSMLGLTPEDSSAEAPKKKAAPKQDVVAVPPAAPSAPASTTPFGEMSTDEKKKDAYKDMTDALADMREAFNTPPHRMGIEPVEMKLIRATVKLLRGAVKLGVAKFEDFVAMARDVIGDDLLDQVSDYLRDAWEIGIEESKPGGEFGGFTLQPTDLEGQDVIQSLRRKDPNRKRASDDSAAPPPSPPTPAAPTPSAPVTPPRPETPSTPVDMTIADKRQELRTTYGLDVQEAGGRTFTVFNSAKLGSKQFGKNKDAIKSLGGRYERSNSNWYFRGTDPTEKLYDAVTQEAPQKGAPGYRDRRGLPDGIEFGRDGRLLPPSPIPGREGQQGPEENGVITARWEYTEDVDTEVVPASLVGKLTKHQLQGAAKAIKSMLKVGGFLLADGAGVGKTRQILTVAKYFADQGKKVLIVTMNQAIESPFAQKKAGVDEVSLGSYTKDGKDMGVEVNLIGDGTLEESAAAFKPGQIHVTAYHEGKFADSIVAKDQRAPTGLWRLVDADTVLILDEAHEAKNAQAKKPRANQIYKATEAAGMVMIATATPGDKIYHMAYLKRTGMMLGMDEDRWMEAAGLYRSKNQSGSVWQTQPGLSNEELLRRLGTIWDHMTRQGHMVKREMSFSRVESEFVHLKLDPKAHGVLDHITRVYEEHFPSINGMVKARLLMARRVNQEPFKIGAAVEQIKNELHEGRQVIVFLWRVNANETVLRVQGEVIPITESQGTVKQLREALAAIGVEDMVELHSNSKQETAEAVRRFQAGDSKVMLATVQSGGTGINLDDTTGKNPRTIIVMTPPWTPSDVVQLVGRGMRLTTKSNLRVKWLFGDTDVDAHAEALIHAKMSLLRAIVKGAVSELDPSQAKLMQDMESPPEDDARVQMTNSGLVGFTGSSYRTKADVPPPYNMNEDASQNPNGTVVYNPMQIAAQMRAEFDLPMNRGRLQMRSKGVMGEYSGHYEAMNLDYGREGNLGVIFHELSHHLDKVFGLTDFLSANAKTATKLGSGIEAELQDLDYEQDPKKGRRAGEGFAEWLKVYMLHDPAYAEQIAPKTYAWFQRWLKLQPKTAKKLALIRGMAQAYVKATPGERAAVHRADNPKRVQLPMSLAPSVTVSTPPVRTPATLSKFAEAVVDATLTNLTEEARPLWKFGNEYQRRGGQFDPEGGFLHPAVWYEAVDTAGAGGFYGMNIPLYSPDGTRILAPAYSEILQNSGFDSDSDEYAKFADYHQSKRMLRLYDESGGKYQVPGDRDQLVRNIAVVENNPTLKAKAEAFSKALTDWDNAFMGWMKEMGAISNQEEMDMLDAHGEDYASLMREIPNDSMFLKPRSGGSSAAGTDPYQNISKKGSMAPLIDPIAATVIRVQRGMQYAFRRRTEAAILRMLQDTSVSGLGKFAMIVRPTMEETVIALDRLLKQLDDLGALRYSRQVIRAVNMIRNGLTDAVPKTWLKLIAKEFGVTVKWKDQAAVDAFIDDIENGRVSRMGHHGKVETVDDIPSVNAELSYWDPKMENDAYSRVVVMRDANSRPYLVRLNPELHDLLGLMAFDTPGFGTMVFNMAGRMVSTGAIAFNPSWAVKNAFGDVHGSFAKSEQQSEKPADIAEQIAMLVPNMTRAFFNAWMPNASRKALSAAYGLFTSTGAPTAGDQAMGGAYWREYERAGFTTGHATSEQPAAVASNVRRLFGQGLLRRVKANLRRKQLATAAGDVSGALADKISFSDVVARFPEFVATINRLGFFEDADGNWVRRRFDANGKVVSEVKYAALPQGVLSAATAAARDVSLNYWRKGRLKKKYEKSLGPFLWAAFAGTNMLRRNVEAAFNHPDPAVRERVRRRLLYWTAAQVIGTAINWLLNHDEEWYKENLQRDAKYIYKYHNVLDQNGNVIARFPRGYNYSAPSILTEGLLNSMEAEVKGSGHKAASQIALQALSPAVRDQLPFQSFWQMISQVPIAGPVINVAANTSYDGRPIVSRDLADLLPGAQVKPSTSIIARKLGQLFPNSVSPVQLDYLMDQIAGGFPGNYIDAVEALAKGHVAEGFRRLFLGGLTPWTENQQSIDALYDRGAELRRLEQSKEWIAENGIDAEEPDMHEQKVIAYTMRMLSAIGRDNKGFTKEERAAHDRLRIGTARAALNKDPLPLYPDAFSKDTDLPSKALEEKRDEFLVSFVRALSSNRPTSLTAREKEAGKSLDDKVRRWEADRALAVAFLKKKGYSQEDAVNLYKKRYGKEVGREAIRNSTHRIIKSFTDSEDTQTRTSS